MNRNRETQSRGRQGAKHDQRARTDAPGFIRTHELGSDRSAGPPKNGVGKTSEKTTDSEAKESAGGSVKKPRKTTSKFHFVEQRTSSTRSLRSLAQCGRAQRARSDRTVDRIFLTLSESEKKSVVVALARNGAGVGLSRGLGGSSPAPFRPPLLLAIFLRLCMTGRSGAGRLFSTCPPRRWFYVVYRGMELIGI